MPLVTHKRGVAVRAGPGIQIIAAASFYRYRYRYKRGGDGCNGSSLHIVAYCGTAARAKRFRIAWILPSTAIRFIEVVVTWSKQVAGFVRAEVPRQKLIISLFPPPGRNQADSTPSNNELKKPLLSGAV